MLAKRLRFALNISAIALVLLVLVAPPARAGVFDDDEARRQIKDLTIKTNERLETLSKAQFELVTQIQALRDENSRLNGQIETLTYELDSAKKRQQDFYVDLDGRLRKFESSNVSQSAVDAPSDEEDKVSDPAAAARDYEAALNLFKANKTKEAGLAFDAFVKNHPDSNLAPNAQYWLGNAYYAQRDCKKAIDAHRVLISKWSQNAKAPDALINIATCQQELGDAKGAKTSLEAVLAKYPESSAAATAKQRLKK